ncbi:MAG: S-adenosylmethionine:tRNA ribosyltransferase-isomerase [Chitinophagales bacterium]
MDPRNLLIKDFTYSLPEDRIAKYPLPGRDASKLLVYHNGKIMEDIYKNLDQHLPEDSLLIFNDTKVIEARILFQKKTGGVIEIFCLEPHQQYDDIIMGMTQKKRVLWRCMIGGASKWKHGQVLEKKIRSGGKEIFLLARYAEKLADSFVIEFSWNDELSFAEILHDAGAIPLPPYIKREPEKSDAERYQTIYAHHEGSVAAPTAGLHFTDDLLEKIKTKNLHTDFVTLHVGAGTFKPVKSLSMGEHEMHSECINVSKPTIKNILNNLSGNIIPVGTTSLRTVESLYWLGVKLRSGEKNNLTIEQWLPYEIDDTDLSPAEALITLIDFMNKENREYLNIKTRILIAPSYKTKIAKALVTNFHQPQSTLLLLVAALIGNDWKKIYEYALKNNFRFLSYGDGCLLWINPSMQERGK